MLKSHCPQDRGDATLEKQRSMLEAVADSGKKKVSSMVQSFDT